MSRLPAMQFYPADWQSDPGIRALGFFDRGVWFEMLCVMHFSSERGVLLLNGRAMTDDEIARSLGLDKQILTTTLTTLVTSGVASRRESDGAIMSRRMVRDEHIRQERIKAGKSGGNPNLLKQNPTTGDKQIPTPSSSATYSSTSTNNRKESIEAPDKGAAVESTKHKKQKSIDERLRELVFPNAWNRAACDAMRDWLEYRSEIRKPLTSRSLQTQIKKYESSPTEFIKAVDHSIGKGWVGLFAPDPPGRMGGKLSAEEQRKKNWEILEGKGNESRTDNAIFESSDGGVQVFSANRGDGSVVD